MARGIRLADVSLGFDDDAGGDPASGFVDQNLADEIGGNASLTALQDLKDRSKVVVDTAQRAVERIKMRPSTTLRTP